MLYKAETARKIAENLLHIQAVKLNVDNPFTWASGWKSPIYCDNRQTLAFPEIRNFIKESFCNLIRENYPEVEVIAGVATAGIAHASFIADELALPMMYVRSKPKGHGMQNLIEGKLLAGQKAVVVEDLFSTGGSAIKAINALREAGAEVIGCVAIFSYGFPKIETAFKEVNCSYYTLSNYSKLLPVAIEKNYIDATQLPDLEAWANDPATWKV